MAKITRSIDQIIFRHSPMSFIALEDGGMFGIITEIGGKQDTSVDKNILLKKVKQYVKKWEEDSEDRVLGFSSDEINDETVIAIKPEENIKWDFLPNSLFQCSNDSCKVVINSYDQFFKGRCHNCSSKLKQFRYVWYHPCGVIRAFQPIPDTFCNNHGKEFLYLNDTGRFKSSTWRCLKCQHESSLRMLPCPNVLCRKKSADKRNFFLQGAVWSDPWVYFSQVATFVNLKDDQIKPILNSEIKDQLLISAYLGTIKAGQGNLRNKASTNNANIICTNCGASVPGNSKFCLQCGTKVVNIPKEIKIDIGKDILLDPLSDDSDLAIFAAVRDLEMTLSFKDEKNKYTDAQNNIEKAATSELIMASLNKIGIDDIYLISDFPLTHIAYGYTRFQSKPPSWLRAFPPISQTDTKVPVYTNCVTTEAWMVQLSAKHTMEWLIENKILKTTNIKVEKLTESDAKLWLLELLNKESESEDEIKIQTVINELIHSSSHTLLYSLAIESGLDIASFGEILLHKALSFIVYGGESDVGGLSASFQQGLGSLIDSIKNDLRSCKFDPSCSEDDDGACVGCLYIPRGCVEFNEKLSRSYIFGGKTTRSGLTNIPYGYLDFKNR